MVSIKDVAATSGLSVATVSRALNGHPSVSDGARQKVLAAVDALGYRPNVVARSRTGNLCLSSACGSWPGTGGGFSLVEHPIPPLSLVAPLHRHAREDEYSFVLEAGVRPLRLREGDPRLALVAKAPRAYHAPGWSHALRTLTCVARFTRPWSRSAPRPRSPSTPTAS